jgi:hypothetical protein
MRYRYPRFAGGIVIDRKCERCGSPFRAKEADVKRGWGRFCSKSCKAKKQTATQRSMPKWARDDIQFDIDMHGATGGWDEGGWLSDDSGVSKL